MGLAPRDKYVHLTRNAIDLAGYRCLQYNAAIGRLRGTYMTATEIKPAQQDKPVWHHKVQHLYRAALYWGLGKRSAWALANAAHTRATFAELDDNPAMNFVTHDDLDHIDKPFVNDARLARAAQEQVPGMCDLDEVDHSIMTTADPQVDTVVIFALLEELHGCGLRRKRTKDGGWKFYIKGQA